VISYAIRRLAVTVPILFAISFATFWAAGEISSPAAQLTLNPRISAEAKQAYIESLGLDRPFHVQYFKWLGNFVTGDLGTSLVKNGQDVWPFVERALANTLLLVAVAVTISLAIGITIGAISAIRQNSLIDYTTTGVSFLGISIPVFWLGLMLQLFFGLYLAHWLGVDPPLLPTAGIYEPGQQGFDLVDRTRHLVLPAIALSVQLVAVYSRYMRASMLDVMGSDYIRTARSKGLSERTVVVKHGVRTALIPVTTQAAVDIGLLVGGLIVTERVFQYPGMGLLFLDALASGDYTILLPSVMIVALAVFFMNMLADLFYAVLDPRIRHA
jgi:peptide/nickel transport system permease protein